MIRSKKFRRINIDGEVYGWMIKETYDYLIVYIEAYYSESGTLEIYVKSDIGKFWIDFPYSSIDNLRNVQPKDVRTMILYALKNGWNPKDKSCVKAYLLEGENFRVKEK